MPKPWEDPVFWTGLLFIFGGVALAVTPLLWIALRKFKRHVKTCNKC